MFSLGSLLLFMYYTSHLFLKHWCSKFTNGQSSHIIVYKCRVPGCRATKDISGCDYFVATCISYCCRIDQTVQFNIVTSLMKMDVLCLIFVTGICGVTDGEKGEYVHV